MSKSEHTLALEFVAAKVKGKINHRQGKNFGESIAKIGSNIPDVISDGAIHEVEVFHISHKVQGYSGVQGRKILWIIFDANPLLSFDTMNFLVALNGHIVEPSKDLSTELTDFKKTIKHQIREDKDELCRLQLEARIQHNTLLTKKQSNKNLKEDLWKITKEEKEYIAKVNQAKTLDRDIEHKVIHLREITEQIQSKTRSMAVLDKRLELIRSQVKPVALYAEYKSGKGIVTMRITKEQFDKLTPFLGKLKDLEDEE